MMSTTNFGYTKALTHGGVFHADDVFSAALLTLLNPDIEIKRVIKVDPQSIEDDTIVFDIGFGKFDHHQADAEVRPNGIKYAAFGLLWREFGHMLVNDSDVEKFDQVFVQKIDFADNGGESNPISMSISAFVPNWDESRKMDEAFFDAVDMAKTILRLHVKRMQATERASMLVKEAFGNSDGNIVVLDKFMPSIGELAPTTAKFVIFPSLRGGFNAQAIPNTPGGRDQKIPFPKEWRGLDAKSLNDITPGVSFCHPAGFLIAVDTEENAIKACKLAMTLA